MKKLIYVIVSCFFVNAAISCTPDTEKAPVEEPTKPTEPNTDDIDYSKVGIEYDDGKNIIFHIKIAIDKEGHDMRDAAFFKSRLKTQWEEINKRFNGLDKIKKLKRNYIFVPDLEDIILYNHSDNAADPSSSHWEVPKHHNSRIDRKKFQCLVVYDFAVQAGEKGGGFGDDNGLGNILVINPGTQNIGKFYDHFLPSALGVESITHELGHFRGVVDTYLTRVSGKDNPINGQGFEPEQGNMNNPYPALNETSWSEYEMRVMNANGAKKEQYLLHTSMRDYFPDYIDFLVKENGQPVQNCKLNIYKVESYAVVKEPIKSFDFEGGTLRKGGHETFWHNDWVKWAWTYHNMLFVEAINTKTGSKGYSFVPAYVVHNQGLKDKTEDKIAGKSIFKQTIEIPSSK